ncbi:MAG: Gfo/Idh/MocA family oxidoreductase [Polyangiaceae bacterium]|nr:Gfo/Idh/MocA family oxidoreductase [Polyangiaceae bacterium]
MATTLRRKLRLGMIGGGKGAFIGAVHRIAARLDNRYELVAGALSSDPTRARESAIELGIAEGRAYGSYAEMIEKEKRRADGVDVVSIVTPNHMHFGPAKACLEAGIHVICDKPLTTTVSDAEELVALVEKTGLVFGVTHNYTGYPMIRQAREMVRSGELGAIRVVQAEYPQGWLATNLEGTGQKQAAWRTDPTQSGQGGCLGDIGTHAFNLAAFVSGLRVSELAADLGTFVPGRQVDDNVHVLLRYANGAKGMLWSSQVAVGHENSLKLRVYGERGSLLWEQEHPNHLTHLRLNDTPRLLTRGGAGLGAAAGHATRIPSGHPEGYLEGFAQLYADLAEQISAAIEKRKPNEAALLVPTVKDGLDAMRFIQKTVESSQKNTSWVKLA